MIIRMTVEDNDFTELVENFANSFKKRFYEATKSALKDNHSPEIALILIETEDIIRNALWAESMKSITDEAKTLLKARLNIMWSDYILSLGIKDSTKEYLNKHFNCSFTFTYKDKWENGEAVYYFTMANKWISQ